jgi:hypothetical protein
VTVLAGSADRPARAVDSPLDLGALDGGLLAGYLAAFAVGITTTVVAAASLVVRFRRARGVERQQLRWVAAVGIPVAMAGIAIESAAVVDQTMQPTQASLWLRPSDRPASVVPTSQHTNLQPLLDRSLPAHASSATDRTLPAGSVNHAIERPWPR